MILKVGEFQSREAMIFNGLFVFETMFLDISIIFLNYLVEIYMKTKTGIFGSILMPERILEEFARAFSVFLAHYENVQNTTQTQT